MAITSIQVYRGIYEHRLLTFSPSLASGQTQGIQSESDRMHEVERICVNVRMNGIFVDRC